MEKKYLIKIIVISVITWIAFYIFNLYTPLFADDYSYSLSFLTREKISSIYDIVQSQIQHYEIMNGRSIVHFLAQIFLYLGKPTFNIINSFVFVALIFVIYFYSYGTFKNFNIYWFLLINFILWEVTPNFGQSFLWVTGSANYLYGIFIVLLFLLPYKIKLDKNFKININHNILQVLIAIIYFFAGIIAGWTNENTGAALIVMIILFLVTYKIKKEKYSLWMFSGLIGSILGFIIMLISPGQSSRLSKLGGFGSIFLWITRFYSITVNVFDYLMLLIILLCFCIIVYIYLSKNNNLEKLSNSVIFLIGTLISIYSMILSPSFPERAWSGIIIIFIIAIGNIYSLIDWNSNKMAKNFITSIMIILSLNFTFNYINAYFDLKWVKVQNDMRVSYIQEQKKEGNLNIELETIKGYSKYSCYGIEGDLVENKNEWQNTIIARYYGLESISKK